MKLKKWYFRNDIKSPFNFVEAKIIRGALTQIKKKQRVFAEIFLETTFCSIFEDDIKPSNMRCVLATYVLPYGDIKQDILEL